ncbi:MAG: hypothetical protein ACREUZ_17450 [Burkholderiales bacterium]
MAGRTPNVAERAGVLEDYILADVKPAGGSAASPSTPGAVGTSGTSGKMYKLEQIADERLKDLVGKRVEVMGRIDAEAGDTRRSPGAPGAGAPGAPPQPDQSVGPDRIELAEFEVTSIREVEGGAPCPAKPSSR